MLTETFSLLFYLKKGRNYTKGKLSIYLRITVDGQRFEMARKGIATLINGMHPLGGRMEPGKKPGRLMPTLKLYKLKFLRLGGR